MLVRIGVRGCGLAGCTASAYLGCNWPHVVSIIFHECQHTWKLDISQGIYLINRVSLNLQVGWQGFVSIMVCSTLFFSYLVPEKRFVMRNGKAVPQKCRQGCEASRGDNGAIPLSDRQIT